MSGHVEGKCQACQTELETTVQLKYKETENMGWLSLGTKILAKTWKGGAKATSSLWKGGSTVLGGTSKILGAAAKNPKTAATLGVASFAGWKMLDDPNKSFGTAVGETVRQTVNGSGDFAHDVVNGFTGENTVEDIKEGASVLTESIKETLGETKGLLGTLSETLQGLGKFIGNIFGGNGTNMFANFFNNFGDGKVSGLSIAGLLAACYMMFGRSGLLGKIGGALLAMMLIGGNSQRQSVSNTETLAQNQSQDQQRGMRR